MSSPRRLRPVRQTCFVIGLAVFAGCNLPRAKLANLRELHQPDGQMSYVGNVMGDMEYALSGAFSSSFLRIEGFDGLNPAASQIEDPCGADLENLNDLAAADSSDIYFSGLQIEAFGWLGADDQYVLGRERAVIELGRAGVRLRLDGPRSAPEAAATAELLSPLLANLARAGLGSLPEDFEGEQAAALVETTLDLPAAIATLETLELDRAGAQRALAVCDVLFHRVDALRYGSGSEALALRKYALEVQSSIVGLALGEALHDPAPVVRAAAFEAVAGFPGGPPPGLLQVAGADPDVEVAARALLLVADRGLPLERVPEDERAEAQKLWINFLVGQAQAPQGRLAFAACAALSRVVLDGPGSLRPEEWSAWWRSAHPGELLPMPIVSGSASG